MRGRRPRRRLRIRRKRKGETFGSKLKDTALEGAAEFGLKVGVDAGTRVVGHMGGCVVEAVGGAAILVALLAVPAFLLIR